MITARRAAREAALLVLFAVDARHHRRVDDVEGALTDFAAHFNADEELLGDLFADGGDEPPAGLIRRARKILDPQGEHWPFVERLVRGVAAHARAIDELIGKSSLNWKVARMGRVDRSVLRLAVYELAFESDVPSKATLNEAIEIAKRYGTEDSGKFVNGILDRIAQDLERV
ncbi:MAG: transcription antitermination factor NusB [Myxococcales bacterium]|nr:transcription antitermination factor NusB [Myxococcales bacterium]